MLQRGRKSATAIAAIKATVDAIQRPEPPDDLTTDQAQEWRTIVDRLPADWFMPETHSLLAMYVGHVCEARFLNARIQEARAAQPFDQRAYDELLRMRERESRAASSLATRMRITQQSTIHSERKKPATLASTSKPWEIDALPAA